HDNKVFFMSENDRARLNQIIDNEANFEGIGKLKDFKVKIVIDKNVTPVVQKVSRIPFMKREQCEKEVNKLLQLGVIESVQTPSSWVSPISLVPKRRPDGSISDDEIRICLDLRRANTAIKRQNFQMPTIEETLEEIHGATV